MSATVTQINDMRNKKASEQQEAVYQYVKELVTGGTEEELRRQRIEASRNYMGCEDERGS